VVDAFAAAICYQSAMGEFADARGLGQRLMESPAIVAIYESRLWRRNPIVEAAMGISFADELERIAEAAHIDTAARVLDLACGPGIYARRFARRLPAGRVVGLDLSRPMLAHAQRRRRDEALGNFDLVRGSALHLPFAAARFDVVNCCGALHLFPDVPQALAEVRRVLAPGGRFTAAVIRAGGGRAARLRRLLGVHAFTRDALTRLLEAAGLADVSILHERRQWMLAAAVNPDDARFDEIDPVRTP
jgi:SAM-dependent methyltransferase